MIVHLDPLTVSPGMGVEPLDGATPVAIGEHTLLVCGGHPWSDAVPAPTARTSLWTPGGRVDAALLPGPRAYSAGVTLATGALFCGGTPAGLEVDVYSAVRGTWSRTEPRGFPPLVPPDFGRVHEILAR